MRNWKYAVTAICLTAGLLMAGHPLPAAAQVGSSADDAPQPLGPDLRVWDRGDATQIELDLDLGSAEIVAASAQELAWPLVDYEGHALPLRLTTVIVDPGTSEDAAPFEIQALDAVPWQGELVAAAALTPPVLHADEMPDYLLPEAVAALPTAPVVVLREGRIRGQQVRVLGISPLFRKNGQMMLAKRLSVAVPGTEPLTQSASELFAASTGPVVILAADDLAPPNGAANQKAVKLRVGAPGLQSVPLAELQAAGLNVDNVDRLGVMERGRAVPAQVMNGALTFYADAAGDYWNTGDIHWVTDSGANVARMATRAATPGTTAPLLTEAFEPGIWRANQIYSSLFSGPGGDHWFAAQMRANTFMTEDHPTIDAVLENQLPLAGSGQLALELRSTTRRRAAYELNVQVGALNGTTFTGAATKTVAWDSRAEPTEENDWITTVEPVGVRARVLRITLEPPEPSNSGGTLVESFAELFLDEIAWWQKVTLDFGGKSAIFDGYVSSELGTDAVRYQLKNVPANIQVYDITDPQQPVRLTNFSASGGQAIFQDSTATSRRYLVTGSGAAQPPQVVAHSATNVTAANGGAHLIYIAPAELHATLQQLADYRAGQDCATNVRCRVRIVDVQQIYDAYSFGYVDPEAIRQYLRYAVANWNPAPISVVLVGDGTQDPKNYEGNELSPNLIPPYLAYRVGGPNENTYVDPFIRQTGCDNCFAQLDGADPLTGDDPVGSAQRPGSSFFPDIMIGRLPVKNAAELRDLIAKLIRYEREYNAADPRNEKLVFLTDNFVKSCEPDGPKDTAGNFAAHSDEIIATLPDSLIVDRIYYDPTQIYDPQDRDKDGTTCDYATPRSSRGYLEGNPETVYNKVQSTLRSGAGLVTYNGHASQWRWAVTERETNSSSPVPARAPEHLFYIWDVLSLTNVDQPFISLAMSCLTSQFHKPVDWGMTLDEHLLIGSQGVSKQAGAVATWGSTGLSVAQGHFALERGFHKTLWAKTDGRARMGDLVMGGYLEQYTTSGCCDDVRRTFLLMGDPMTRVRLGEIDGAYLPTVAKQ